MSQYEWVVFCDSKDKVCYEFISNLYDLSAEQITQIYKHRWQIEIPHKQLKQNHPLNYVFGDNVNAINIQIGCAPHHNKKTHAIRGFFYSVS